MSAASYRIPTVRDLLQDESKPYSIDSFLTRKRLAKGRGSLRVVPSASDVHGEDFVVSVGAQILLRSKSESEAWAFYQETLQRPEGRNAVLTYPDEEDPEEPIVRGRSFAGA